jgi:shikimate 5-dehydrogenase
VPHREAILDPTGLVGAPRSESLAPRVHGLSGLRLGLLDNTKANAACVLETLAEQLRAQHHVGEVNTYTKSYFGTPVEEDRAREIAQSCDAVIAGVGD